jgi:cadmium resistance protein CadD (predicted permease)
VAFCPLCAGLVRSTSFSKALGPSGESKRCEQSCQRDASGSQRSGAVSNVVAVVTHTEITSVLAAIVASVTTFAATNVDDLFLLSVFFARREPMRRVMAGQYLGFAGIVGLSMFGVWAALAIPLARFRFLGFLPLAIGIKRLLHLRKAEVPPASNFKVLSIAAITLANGGDNLGVYVPFFAVKSAHLGVILASYTALLPIWCLAGKWLGERSLMLRSLDRYGHWFVPTVFIGLGLYILI